MPRQRCRDCGERARMVVAVPVRPSPLVPAHIPQVTSARHPFCHRHGTRFLKACAKWHMPAEPAILDDDA